MRKTTHAGLWPMCSCVVRDSRRQRLRLFELWMKILGWARELLGDGWRSNEQLKKLVRGENGGRERVEGAVTSQLLS
jgi:hypothetical protein